MVKVRMVCFPAGTAGPASPVPERVHERVPDGAAGLPDLGAVHHLARHR